MIGFKEGEWGGAYTILDPILEPGRHNLQSSEFDPE